MDTRTPAQRYDDNNPGRSESAPRARRPVVAAPPPASEPDWVANARADIEAYNRSAEEEDNSVGAHAGRAIGVFIGLGLGFAFLVAMYMVYISAERTAMTLMGQ